MLQHRQRLTLCQNHIVEDFDLWRTKGFPAGKTTITLLAFSVFTKAFRCLQSGQFILGAQSSATQIYLSAPPQQCQDYFAI
jgi:hypothetical protein